MAEDSEPLPPLRECLSWVWRSARRDRRFYATLLVLALLVPVLVHLPSLLLMYIVDALDGKHELSGVRLAVAAVLSAGLIQSTAGFLRGVGARWLEGRLQLRLEGRALRIFFSQPFLHQAKHPAGYVNQRIRSDINEPNALFPSSFFNYITNFLSIFAALAISAAIHPWIAVVALINLVVTGLLVRGYLGRLRLLRREFMETSAVASRVFVEGVGAGKELLALNAVHWQSRRYGRRRAQQARLSIKSTWTWHLMSLLQGVLAQTATAVVLWMGIRLVAAGKLTPGQVVALYSLLNSVFGPAVFLIDILASVQNSLIALQRFVGFSRTPAAPPPITDLNCGDFSCRCDLELRNVHFSYLSGGELLSNVSLSIRPGECLVLGGPSGVGKSTLLLLLAGFLEPTSGAILFDGLDASRVPRELLRSRVALVPAEGTLFQETVRANLLLANPGADASKIREALHCADALDFVERLPRGLETVLDSGGHRLSMGQRQRLVLARALLQDPDMLILDETTSMLDLETEARILSRLKKTFSQRILWIVSHRPSVACAATRFVRLQNGRVEELAAPAAVRA